MYQTIRFEEYLNFKVANIGLLFRRKAKLSNLSHTSIKTFFKNVEGWWDGRAKNYRN